MEKNNKTYYEFNQSQDVVNLQCKYSIFKRVMNIITSASTSKKIDLDIMKEALNQVVARNDCLRIRFCKQKGKMMQYFLDEYKYEDIPYVEFKTKEEFDNFILKFRKTAIKYMKGQTFEPYFCKTYDGKFMILIKVCHLILDIFGICNIFKDLFAVYDALEAKTELPPVPPQYKDIIKKDLTIKNNEEFIKTNEQFFIDLYKDKERPCYAGIHGPQLPLVQKLLKQNRPTMKMFLINNKTDSAIHEIDKKTMDKVVAYCDKNKYSMANFMMYTFSLCEAILNNNIKNMIQLELCNCRGTVSEKKAGGTKAQSLACYTHIDYDQSFDTNMKQFVENQTLVYKHIGYPDVKFELLFGKLFKKPLLDTYYSCTFSFIPFESIKDVDIITYSNGRFVLPAYIAQIYDVPKNTVQMAYDYQKKIITAENVAQFHKNYVSIINQVTDNSNIQIKDIKIEK